MWSINAKLAIPQEIKYFAIGLCYGCVIGASIVSLPYVVDNAYLSYCQWYQKRRDESSIPNKLTIDIINTDEITAKINNIISSNSTCNFECPVCDVETVQMKCTRPDNVYSKNPGQINCGVYCNKCGRTALVVFTCPNGHSPMHPNGFDYCFDCGLKHFNVTFDADTLNKHNVYGNQDTQAACANIFAVFQKFRTILSQFKRNKHHFRQYSKSTLCKPRKEFSQNFHCFYNYLRSCNHDNVPSQRIEIDYPDIHSKHNESVQKPWNAIFDTIINQIKGKQLEKTKLIVERIWLYNAEYGLIENGKDLKQAVNGTNNCNLTLISNINFLTQDETKSMFELQKQGYMDEMLNYYKLSIYDWDIKKAKKYYIHDDFCVPYCVYPTEKFGFASFFDRLTICSGPNTIIPTLTPINNCDAKHTHNISDMIFKSSAEENAIALTMPDKGLILCEYLMYLRQKKLNSYVNVARDSNSRSNGLLAKYNKVATYSKTKNRIKIGDSLLYTYYGILLLLSSQDSTFLTFFKAEKYFQKAIKCYKNNEFAHIHYGITLSLLNKYKDCDSHFSIGLAICENFAKKYNMKPFHSINLYLLYGMNLVSRNEFGLSLKVFLKIQKIVQDEQFAKAVGANCNDSARKDMDSFCVLLEYMISLAWYKERQFLQSFCFISKIQKDFKLDNIRQIMNGSGKTELVHDQIIHHDCWLQSQFYPMKISHAKLDGGHDSTNSASTTSDFFAIKNNPFKIGDNCVSLMDGKQISLLVDGYTRFFIYDIFGINRKQYDFNIFSSVIKNMIGESIFNKHFSIQTNTNYYKLNKNANRNDMNFILFDGEVSSAHRFGINSQQRFSLQLITQNDMLVQKRPLPYRIQFGIVATTHTAVKSDSGFKLIERMQQFEDYTQCEIWDNVKLEQGSEYRLAYYIEISNDKQSIVCCEVLEPDENESIRIKKKHFQMNLSKKDDVSINVCAGSDAEGVCSLSFDIQNERIDSKNGTKWQKMKHYVFFGSSDIDCSRKLRVVAN